MRKQKKLIKILFFIVASLILVLFILLIFNFNFFKIFFGIFHGSEKIVISDDCGVVLGNLIHEIKDEDNCKIMCRNECELKDKFFVKIEFNKKENSCYECNCFCK